MIIIKIIQLQFLLLVIFLVCMSIAGAREGVFWFILSALIMGTLFLAGKIVHSRR